jgi:hypothetical protein
MDVIICCVPLKLRAYYAYHRQSRKMGSRVVMVNNQLVRRFV